jgi:hypothetical protein
MKASAAMPAANGRAKNDGEASREIVSRRLIDAPREKIFGAISDPERLARWWGPQGLDGHIWELMYMDASAAPAQA